MSIPDIRFKGFNGDWERRKVTELGEIYIGLVTTMTSHYTDVGSLLIRNSDIKDGYFEFGNNPIYLDEEFSKQNASRKHQIGDVITVHTGDIGTSAVISEKEAGSIGFATIVTRPYKNMIKSDYLCTYLNTDTHKRFAINISTGDGRNNYNLRDYYECTVPVPSIEEQSKISEYIKTVNSLITLNQRKCDSLKELKKGMLQKMFPRNGAKVPEFRFKGFTGDWEQRKFHEVFYGLQNNTLSRSDLNYDDGEVQNVHYGDVLIKFGEYVDVSIEKLPYIRDKTLADKFRSSYLQDGDIIIADTAEDATVGKCTEIVGSNGKKIISGLHTIPCRPKQAYAPKFLGYYMNSNAYHAQFIPLMQGIKVTSISKGVLQDTDMVMPILAEEQEKIGSYFSSLDNLITLHQRKCDTLKNLKKGLLQKMFPEG